MITADKHYSYAFIIKVLMVFSVLGFGKTVYNLTVSTGEPSSNIDANNAEIVENLREIVDRDEKEAQGLRVDEKFLSLRLDAVESRLLRLELKQNTCRN